jgi:hypothetical protein
MGSHTMPAGRQGQQPEGTNRDGTVVVTIDCELRHGLSQPGGYI